MAPGLGPLMVSHGSNVIAAHNDEYIVSDDISLS